MLAIFFCYWIDYKVYLLPPEQNSRNFAYVLNVFPTKQRVYFVSNSIEVGPPGVWGGGY